jgi:DNA (cytosine-5)-methyltransferase 1
MRVLDLFSGIGGFSLAAHWAGMQTAAFCEIEPFCQKVLKKNFPGVPIYDDVRAITKEQLEKDGVIDGDGTIELVCGGFPCQPFSVAGKQRGKEDDRHLWPEMLRIIKELRPTWVVGENVVGLIRLALDDVIADLENEGYTVRTFVIPASAVGAPHKRDRVWIVAHTTSSQRQSGAEESRALRKMFANGRKHDHADGPSETRDGFELAYTDSERCNNGSNYRQGRQIHSNKKRDVTATSEIGEGLQSESWSDGEVVADTDSTGQQKCNVTPITKGTGFGTRGVNQRRGDRFPQSRLGGDANGFPAGMDGHRWPAGLGQEQHEWEPPRVATGIKHRKDRLKALGNAIVPQVAYQILKSIMEVEQHVDVSEAGT